MKRELWLLGKALAHGIQMVNASFCMDTETKEMELTEDEDWLVAEQVNASISEMMLEDVEDVLKKVGVMPAKRLCERVDCRYHHPNEVLLKLGNSFRYSETIVAKCDECTENGKSKLAVESRIHHYEVID